VVVNKLASRGLVRFRAGLYIGYDYRFDLSDLRPLDTNLANACLSALSDDRLGVNYPDLGIYDPERLGSFQQLISGRRR
jgi:hypothetical protein